jgi:hypothetical protein
MIPIFDLGFLVYPTIFIILFFIGVFIVRGHPGKVGVIFIILFVFWVLIYLSLCYMVYIKMLPCDNFLGTKMGGCI